MKYVVVLYDGMADYPVPALGGKTPMMVAKKPNLDYLAQRAEVGLVRTVAPGLKPGSDVANMSVLGFDPMKYYTGRSPLEAASMGIDMAPSDVRCAATLLPFRRTISPTKKKQSKIIAPMIFQPKRRQSLLKPCRKNSGTTHFIFTPAFPTGIALFGKTAQPIWAL